MNTAWWISQQIDQTTQSLEAAIHHINDQIILSLKYSLNELLLSLIINTNWMPLAEISTEPIPKEAGIYMGLAEQKCFDRYAQMVEHKGAFNKWVQAHLPWEVIFKPGSLVQLYRRDLDYTFKTERELLPDFSIPQWAVSHNQHSYKIETLEGYLITGKFSLRHYDSLSSGREQSWRKHRVQLKGNSTEGKN